MEKIRFSEERANSFVREGLTLIGFPDNLSIQRFIGDNNTVSYFVYYEAEVKGKVCKRIKPLTKRNYIDLMKFALQVNGYDVPFIDIRVRDEDVTYTVSTNIVTYDGPRKKKRR